MSIGKKIKIIGMKIHAKNCNNLVARAFVYGLLKIQTWNVGKN